MLGKGLVFGLRADRTGSSLTYFLVKGFSVGLRGKGVNGGKGYGGLFSSGSLGFLGIGSLGLIKGFPLGDGKGEGLGLGRFGPMPGVGAVSGELPRLIPGVGAVSGELPRLIPGRAYGGAGGGGGVGLIGVGLFPSRTEKEQEIPDHCSGEITHRPIIVLIPKPLG
jgi:hypothetical protein